METLLYLFAAYGLCFGVMNDKFPLVPYLRRIPIGKDSEGKTFFTRMFECPYCTGFHQGWVIFLLLELPQRLSEHPSGWFILQNFFLYAFASSAFCYVLDTLVILIESKTSR